MTKAAPLINNFNAGELSPLLEGRPNFDAYQNGLKLCENWIPLVQGPITARPGTKFIHPVKDSSKQTRLAAFEFSTTQAYILEFGDQYIRVFKDNALVTQTAQNITGITKANPAVVTYSGADTYSNGDRIVISGVLGMVEVNNREFTVANVNTGANTFELSGVNSSSYTTYSSGGTVAEVYEISSPYLEADLFQLKFSQSNDYLYIAHPSYAPRKLTRSGHTSWTLSTITFSDGPYLAVNTSATTLTLSGTSGSVTVTASASLFASSDVGRLIRWKDPANNWTWLTITAYTSATVVTATISGPNASAGTATINWRLGVWSSTTGYPGTVTFYGDRLFWAGSTSYPQRLDGSVVGDYENYRPSNAAGTVADDDAVAFTLNANNVNVIRWMIDDEKGLLVGTVGGEWIVRPSTTTEALTPTNIQATRSTGYGSKNIEPARAGKATLFLQRSGRKIRESAFVFEDDGFRAPDLTIRAEHITKGGINQLAFMAEPQSILWAVRGDGQLIGLTYEREQEVVGWHRHVIGGTFSTGDAVVESVACIPSSAGTHNELWLIVKRTVDSATARYIEYLTPLWDEDNAQEDAFFVDSGLTYDSSPTSSVSGLWHLRGQTVTILADGATHPDTAVSSTGVLTLSRSASVIQIGLGYYSDAYIQRLEAGAADGTSQGKKKRIRKITFRFLQALGIKVGYNADNLIPLTFRQVGDDLGAATPLFDGDKTVMWNEGPGEDARVYIRRYQPFPATLLAVMPRVTTQDG